MVAQERYQYHCKKLSKFVVIDGNLCPKYVDIQTLNSIYS